MKTVIPAMLAGLSMLLGPTALAASTATQAWCDYLGKRLRSVSAEACHRQPFMASTTLTARGNPLVYVDHPANPAPPLEGPPRRVLVIGGIHGDELTSISIVFKWLDWIGEAEPARYHWRIIPLANPDGLKVRPSTRVNGNGVDLNRNFQTPDWDENAQAYWVKRTRKDPRRYPGEKSGSELETQWLQGHIDDFQPNLIISVHAPYNLLDYDGPVPKPLRFGRLSLNRLGVYPGSLGNYGGLHKRIPVITIELPNATAMPSQRDQRAMWDDMLVWMSDHVPQPVASSPTNTQPVAAPAQAATPLEPMTQEPMTQEPMTLEHAPGQGEPRESPPAAAPRDVPVAKEHAASEPIAD